MSDDIVVLRMKASEAFTRAICDRATRVVAKKLKDDLGVDVVWETTKQTRKRDSQPSRGDTR